MASTLISQALAKLPKHEGIVYRGETMSMKKLQERFLNHIGEVVSDKGFVSSSLYEDTPRSLFPMPEYLKAIKGLSLKFRVKMGEILVKYRNLMVSLH